MALAHKGTVGDLLGIDVGGVAEPEAAGIEEQKQGFGS